MSSHIMCQCAYPMMPAGTGEYERPDFYTAVIDPYVTKYELRHGKCGNILRIETVPHGVEMRMTWTR